MSFFPDRYKNAIEQTPHIKRSRSRFVLVVFALLVMIVLIPVIASEPEKVSAVLHLISATYDPGLPCCSTLLLRFVTSIGRLKCWLNAVGKKMVRG